MSPPASSVKVTHLSRLPGWRRTSQGGVGGWRDGNGIGGEGFRAVVEANGCCGEWLSKPLKNTAEDRIRQR